MSSYQDTLQHGATIGCYQIEEVLGRGGFAVTYLAIDRNLDVYVAIKEFLPREIISRHETGTVSPRDSEFAEDYQTGLENFAREAKTLALFKHPNIVRVHQVLHENNTAYMVMDYEHGQELAEVLEDQKSLSEQDLRPILLPVLDAVAEIHQQGYVHRDIKPSNIYLRDNGAPVLLDFGAARYTMSETTQHLTAVVTVGYTPIEQYNVSNADQGSWTDIYALSAVLYEAVTGQMPVDSVTRASTALTNAPDPLVSVRDKSLHPCSEHFYDAIDWGLRMDALERPRSVDQWLAALNGEMESSVEQAATSRKPNRPARPSKLRTRAKSLAASETESHHRTSVELAMQDFDIEHYPASRVEPSFGESLDEIDVGDSEQLLGETYSDRAPDNDLSQQPEMTSAGASSGPATSQLIARDTPTIEPPTLLRASHRPDSGSGNVPGKVRTNTSAATGSAADNNAMTMSAGKTHTQEIRDVVRRDIMKRDIDKTPARETEARLQETTHDDNSSSAEIPRRPGRILTRSAAEKTDQNDAEQELEIRPRADAMQFDESDWDYEPPHSPSKWKWLIPATGLAAVFAASLLYVNRPDLFQFKNSNLPALTVDAALEQAQDKVASGQYIFPAGESALDYFQLVLGSEPNNVKALAGVELIENQVRDDIVRSVEDNSLSEANRLLSRANKAGLRVDNIPAAGVAAAADQGIDADRVTAIDQDLSPYLKRQIAKIEQQIENGDVNGAEALFAETDKYLPDTNISTSLQQRIQALRDEEAQPTTGSTQTQNTTLDDTDTSDSEKRAVAVLPATESVLDSTADSRLVDSGTVPPITNSVSEDADKPYPNTEIPARAAITENTVTPAPGTTAPETADSDASVKEAPAAETNTAATNTANTSTTNTTAAATSAAPISAPRKSYIDGRGETARHLNRLRTAIEAKSIDRVLQVSDSLPRERVDFLNQMFRRYDRIDVIIDSIRDQSGRLTANLNVSMFNQRTDGSFYSAGRWNGVTVSSDKVNDQWQKIEW